MATPVQPTTQLNIDNTVHLVEDLTDDLKKTVSLFDSWRQREADLIEQAQALESDLIMVQSALQHAKNSLLAALTPPSAEA